MRNWIIKLGFNLLLLLIICSCNKNCNEKYCMLAISIKDRNKNPVFLDDYTVIKISTGEIMINYDNYPYINSISKKRGSYLLITDGEIDFTSKKGTECMFIGKIDSTIIIQENYIIGNDGRHVTILSGKKKIIADI